MNTSLYFSTIHFRNGQEFNPVSEFPTELNVDGRDFGDSSNKDIFKLDGRPESQPDKDGELVGCINALDIISRVCFGISFLLSFFKDFFKPFSFVCHL